jgi:purine nucleosidase
MTRKIWIDTDAGTDDAIALMMAFADPSIEIVGITTVGGNVALERVVQNVLYLCELCGRDIPVYVGSAQPLNRNLDVADFIHGKDGLGDAGLPAYDRIPRQGDPIEALASAIQKFPYVLELVTLGPLTNIAKFLSYNADLFVQLKKVYIMGGLLSLPGNITPFSEYNIWADPEAADQVLRSGFQMIMVGWDVTLQAAALTLQEIEEIKNIGTIRAKIAAAIQQVRIYWSLDNERETLVTLADPLAMSIVLNDNIISESSYHALGVTLDLDDSPHRGYVTKLTTQQKLPIQVVTKADAVAFREILKKSLSV